MRDLPDEKACRELMVRFDMLPNIVEHSYRVCQVASFLGRALNRQGKSLDLGILMAGSLLHDITKTECLKTRENHSRTGHDLLKRLGYPVLGAIVGSHVELTPEEAAGPLAEAHIVNYADKRVRHECVVTLEERITDIEERYGTNPLARKRLKRIRKGIFKLEKRIFKHLDCHPAELVAFNTLPAFDLTGNPRELTRIWQETS